MIELALFPADIGELGSDRYALSIQQHQNELPDYCQKMRAAYGES